MDILKYKENEKVYYVYEHVLDGEVFYIGKAVVDSLVNPKRNQAWLKKVGTRVGEVETRVRGYFRNKDDALLFERVVTEEALSKGAKLTNINYKIFLHFRKENKDFSLKNNQLPSAIL